MVFWVILVTVVRTVLRTMEQKYTIKVNMMITINTIIVAILGTTII